MRPSLTPHLAASLATLWLVALAALAPGAALADPPRGPMHDGPMHDGPPPDLDEPPEGDTEEFLDRLRLMRMYAMTEALELDEATAAKLFPYLRGFDDKREELHGQLRTERQALRAMALEEKVDAREVDARIEAASKLEVRMAELRGEELAGLRKILTPEQRLKFLLTREKLDRELRRMIRERRRGRRD